MATLRMQSGKWQARVQRKNHPSLSKTFANKSDAVKWSKQIEAAIDRGDFSMFNNSETRTLSNALSRYLTAITPRKKGAKVEGYRINVLNRAKLASMELTKIRSTDIAQYRDERTQLISPNTVKNELNTLSAVFEACRLEWGINVANPVRGLKRPPAPKGRDRRLHPGEKELLLAECSKSRAWYLECVVILAIETGMRLGEIASLRYELLDKAKRTIRLPDTKNGHARTVPLSMAAIAALDTLPAQSNGLMFPVHVDSIKHAFRAAVARARKRYHAQRVSSVESNRTSGRRMLEDLRFHDLRHEAVSQLFEKGLSTIEVSSISGHKTLGMLSRYTHLRAENLVHKLG